MKRKAAQWWSLPATTSQEEFDLALANFKEERYFQAHLEVEWLDVLLLRACGRFVGQPQFRWAGHMRAGTGSRRTGDGRVVCDVSAEGVEMKSSGRGANTTLSRCRSLQ